MNITIIIKSKVNENIKLNITKNNNIISISTTLKISELHDSNIFNSHLYTGYTNINTLNDHKLYFISNYFKLFGDIQEVTIDGLNYGNPNNIFLKVVHNNLHNNQLVLLDFNNFNFSIRNGELGFLLRKYTIADIIRLDRKLIIPLQDLNSDYRLFNPTTDNISEYGIVSSRHLTNTTQNININNIVNTEVERNQNSQQTNTEEVDINDALININRLQTLIERSYTRPIRLENTKKNRGSETLQEFLISFFRTYNINSHTIYADNRAVQTERGKRRSLGDIYMICKYYYPTCNLSDVLALLYHVIPNVLSPGFRTSWCNVINKKVWYYDNSMVNNIANRTREDEYGNNYEFYYNLFEVENLNTNE